MMKENVSSAKRYVQNPIFIRTERRMIDIDDLANFVVRSIFMIIKTEYLIIMKFITKIIDQK